jgi:hypothetical protein
MITIQQESVDTVLVQLYDLLHYSLSILPRVDLGCPTLVTGYEFLLVHLSGNLALLHYTR